MADFRLNIFCFLPYDPQFPTLFEAEKRRLQTQLLEASVIEHFGSTAVPGLGGKGIIDIYVLVPREKLYEVSDKLQYLGYDYHPDGGIVDERLFHRRVAEDAAGTQRIFHVHVAYEGYPDFTQCLAFRDYLCTHPAMVQQYAVTKQKAAQAADQQANRAARRQAYVTGKDPIILEILSELAVSAD
jgi:GrpB-like predicted nucleotidyltransferase (UPF0157 family)